MTLEQKLANGAKEMREQHNIRISNALQRLNTTINEIKYLSQDISGKQEPHGENQKETTIISLAQLLDELPVRLNKFSEFIELHVAEIREMLF